MIHTPKDTWMVALSLDKDKSWLDDPLAGYLTFHEAREAAFQQWPKLEEGESYAFYRCLEIITLKEKEKDDPDTPPSPMVG